MTFWCDAPLFDLEELEEEGRRAFETRFKRASLFRPYVGSGGSMHGTSMRESDWDAWPVPAAS